MKNLASQISILGTYSWYGPVTHDEVSFVVLRKARLNDLLYGI